VVEVSLLPSRLVPAVEVLYDDRSRLLAFVGLNDGPDSFAPYRLGPIHKAARLSGHFTFLSVPLGSNLKCGAKAGPGNGRS